MITAEIKNGLHRLVVETDDLDILTKVLDYFSSLKGEDIDWWEDLSEQQKKMLAKSRQQIKTGETFTHNEVRREIDALINKHQIK